MNGGPQEEPSSESGDLTPEDIMAAIQDVKGLLETKIDTTVVNVNLIKADLRKMNARVHDAEEAILYLTSKNKELTQQVQQLQNHTEAMAAWIEEQEVHSRRNNMRIIGVLERMEESGRGSWRERE